MSRFVLTAQLQLEAPKNVNQVANQLRRQLKDVDIDVSVKDVNKATRDIAKVNSEVNKLNKSSEKLGRTFGLAIKRFSALAVATRAVSLFTTRLSAAIDESIEFQRELIKISQVTGKSLKQLEGLNQQITSLAISLGASSKELLSTSRILAQAGIEAKDLEIALTALAKTTLAPTFDDISKTAEGAVAILAQFGRGVGALEEQLGAVNAVSGQFAVESGDLIAAIRRTGGVFKAAGGDLNELIALFTSVRATTRESAESISTGLRTIFTRIQRPSTIQFLKEFGIELTDLEGKFIGPYEAIRQLSVALSGLEEGDIRFIKIAEELGGFRQIGKVIPLIQQFETAERARQAAIEGGNSLTKDAETAQQALAVQISQVKQEFLALVRSLAETSTFQILVKTTLDLTSNLISLASAFKEILPLIGVFAGLKIARGVGGFLSGIGSAATRRANGGRIHHFASGGMVPGSGVGDTVPAMLSPGEFVIRKSSVNKIGAGTLAAMNANKFAKGGPVKINSLGNFAKSNTYTGKLALSKNEKDEFILGQNQFTKNDTIEADIQRKSLDVSDIIRKVPVSNKERLKLAVDYNSLSDKPIRQGGFWEHLLRKAKLLRGKSDLYGGNAPLDGIYTNNRLAEAKRTPRRESELLDKRFRHEFKANAFVGQKLTASLKNPDRLDLSGLIELTPNAFEVDLKPFQEDTNESKKTATKPKKRTAKVRRATGGRLAGSDTVPAMLTPGEFVINKKAAAQIGRSNLETMNKKGVVGFNEGGATGSIPNRRVDNNQTRAIGFSILSSSLTQLIPRIEEASTGMQRLYNSLADSVQQIVIWTATLKSFNPNFAFKNIFKPRGGSLDPRQSFGRITGRFKAGFRAGGGGFGGFIKGLQGASSRLATFAAAGAAVTAGFYVAIKAIDAYSQVHLEAEKAIKEGNVAKAKETAIASKQAKNANTSTLALAGLGAAIGAFGGPVGSAIGALIGGSIGLADKFGLLGGVLGSTIQSISEFFGGQTLEQIGASAAAQAAVAKVTLDFEKNVDKASNALAKVDIGEISLEEAFKSGDLTGNLSNLSVQVKTASEAQKLAAARAESSQKGIISSFVRGSATAKTLEEQNKLLKEATKKYNDEIRNQIPNLIKMGRQMNIAGKGFGDFIKTIGEQVDLSLINPELLEKLENAYVANAKAVADNTRAFAAANIGLAGFKNIGDGLNLSFGKALSIIDGSFNELEFAIQNITSASAGVDISDTDFQQSFNTVSSTLKKFGVAEAQIDSLQNKFSSLRTASGNFEDVLRGLSDQVAEGKLTGDTAIKDELINQLSNLEGVDTKFVRDLLSGINLSDTDIQQLSESNYQLIFDKLSEASNKVGEDLQKNIAPFIDAQKKLNELTNKRVEAENKLLQGQLKNIGLQEEAAKILDKLGDIDLGARGKLEFARQRLSANLGGGAGSSGAIGGRLSRLTTISTSAASATSGIAAGKDIQENRRILDQANQNLKSLIDYSRERVKIYQEELDIVKKKNSAELTALEKILTGDIEGAFQLQQQSIAKEAIISGGTGALVGLDSQAIVDAIKELREEGGFETQLRAAAAQVLGPLANRRSIELLSGTTAGERNIRGNIRQEALFLQQAGAAEEAVSTSELNIVNTQLIQTNKDLARAQQLGAEAATKNAEAQRKLTEIADRQQRLAEQSEQVVRGVQSRRQAQTKSRGGIIYASNGMFVPRGTDTVPAMLTPGEFVVNRAAVNRGNNLQILQAMNRGNSTSVSDSGTTYASNGGSIKNISFDDFTKSVSTLSNTFKDFANSVDRLQNFNFKIKLDPTNVNVNLNGGSFMNNLKEELKKDLLSEVANRLNNMTTNNVGDMVYREGIV